MGATTEITWATSTFNPWWGCVEVSDGCSRCYARTFDKRVGGAHWGVGSGRRFFGDKHWAGPLKWQEKAAASGQPWRVFCASMADWLEDRDDLVAPRARLCELIEATPALTWMLLSKRIENAAGMVPRSWAAGWPRNVWALTTTENQEQADKRIHELLKVPAAVRGISAEPLLGPLDIRRWLWRRCPGHDMGADEDGETYLAPCLDGCAPRLDWVIIGGESGHHARPFDLAWARSLIAQCRAAGAAPFFKQAGSRPVLREVDLEQWPHHVSFVSEGPGIGLGRVHLKDSHGGDLAELPAELHVREFPNQQGVAS